ncbi:uncharacterized [Tachysurus ichikawai]
MHRFMENTAEFLRSEEQEREGRRKGTAFRSRLFGKDVFAGGRVGERGGWGGGDLHFDLVAGLTGQPSSNTFYILHPQDI